VILELENICKEYMQGKIPVPVLKNINFSMEEGEYVAIMGPSGSGKTTLMNIVGCLDQATSGRLILDGQDISKCSDNQMSDIRLQKIGFVFQNFQLLARQSAMENVCLPLTCAGVPKKETVERRITQALENIMENRSPFICEEGGERFHPIEGVERDAAAAFPIIGAGDVSGAVVLLTADEASVPTQTEIKLVQVAASFLGKQMEE